VDTTVINVTGKIDFIGFADWSRRHTGRMVVGRANFRRQQGTGRDAARIREQVVSVAAQGERRVAIAFHDLCALLGEAPPKPIRRLATLAVLIGRTVQRS
jgi:hypothetical protein